MAIDLGDVYRLSWTNTDPNGDPVSSGSVSITLTLPDGTTTTLGPVTPATVGVYTYDYTTAQAGRHSARWVGTGLHPGAQAEVFDVRPADPPYIISLADARAQLNFSSTDSDEELRTYLEATTGAIENHLGQKIARQTVTEEVWVSTGGPIVLTWSPVLSLTSVAAADGSITYDVTGLRASINGIVTTVAGNLPAGAVTVTYVAGMPVVPGNIGLAARIVLQHLWETQRGTAGARRPGGMDDSLGYPGMGGAGYALPNRAIELLGGRSPWVG